MKDFLSYLHAELSRLMLIYTSATGLSKEDKDLLYAITETASILESYAETSKNGRLYGIVEDLQYSINHMWVPFKAETALKDVQKNIAAYYQEE
jgi:hypothetical protein